MKSWFLLALFWVFRVTEIRSRAGVLHFRRWRLIENRWFRLFVHQIYKPDQDLHLHNHPWNFASLVLRGGYIEETSVGDRSFLAGDSYSKSAHDYHKIKELLGPTVTLVFAWGPYQEWGYYTPDGYVPKAEYRKMKRAGKWGYPLLEPDANEPQEA